MIRRRSWIAWVGYLGSGGLFVCVCVGGGGSGREKKAERCRKETTKALQVLYNSGQGV